MQWCVFKTHEFALINLGPFPQQAYRVLQKAQHVLKGNLINRLKKKKRNSATSSASLFTLHELFERYME